MLSNVILSTYLQYADHTDLATLPIGVKGRRKEKKRKEEKKRKDKKERKKERKERKREKRNKPEKTQIHLFKTTQSKQS